MIAQHSSAPASLIVHCRDGDESGVAFDATRVLSSAFSSLRRGGRDELALVEAKRTVLRAGKEAAIAPMHGSRLCRRLAARAVAQHDRDIEVRIAAMCDRDVIGRSGGLSFRCRILCSRCSRMPRPSSQKNWTFSRQTTRASVDDCGVPGRIGLLLHAHRSDSLSNPGAEPATRKASAASAASSLLPVSGSTGTRLLLCMQLPTPCQKVTTTRSEAAPFSALGLSKPPVPSMRACRFVRLLVKSGPANARHAADLKERRTAKLLTGGRILPIDAACLWMLAMNTWLVAISLAPTESARMHRSEGVANLVSRMRPMSPFPARQRVELKLAHGISCRSLIAARSIDKLLRQEQTGGRALRSDGNLFG